MAYYAVLAAKGFLPVETLAASARFDSPLGYHPDRMLVPGVEISERSLGHGLGLAVGTALGLRIAGRAARSSCLVGDARAGRGQQHGGDPVRRTGGLGNLTAVVIDNSSARWAGPAGSGGASPSRAGRASTSTAATTTRWSAAFAAPRRGRTPWSPTSSRRRPDDRTVAEDLRTRFYRLLPELLAEDPRAVAVFGEVGVGYLDEAAVAPVADRVINVGIREQLVIGVTGGLALDRAAARSRTRSRPFLIERPFEQVKLDLGHQDVGAVLVSAGGSYDWPEGGETHFGYRDVAVLDTLTAGPSTCPGTPTRPRPCCAPPSATTAGSTCGWRRTNQRRGPADRADGRAARGRGRRGTVVAVGPMADRTLAAVADLDVTVLYATTVRPFDAATLRATLDTPAVVLVEPYLRDTSTAAVARALTDRPHRVLGLGVAERGAAHLRQPPTTAPRTGSTRRAFALRSSGSRETAGSDPGGVRPQTL